MVDGGWGMGDGCPWHSWPRAAEEGKTPVLQPGLARPTANYRLWADAMSHCLTPPGCCSASEVSVSQTALPLADVSSVHLSLLRYLQPVSCTHLCRRMNRRAQTPLLMAASRSRTKRSAPRSITTSVNRPQDLSGSRPSRTNQRLPRASLHCLPLLDQGIILETNAA